MCLIAVAWRAHPRWPLALIANRDELHARPTAEAGFDPEAPEVYGGRDLVQGGGWLQASTRGRLAAVTNVRDGLASEAAPRSRGRCGDCGGSEPGSTSCSTARGSAPSRPRTSSPRSSAGRPP